MAEITWTRESELWLKDIFDYIAVDDPGAAARTVIAIHEKRSYSEIIHSSATSTNW